MLVRVVAQGKLRAMGALGPPRRSNENERGGGGGGGGGGGWWNLFINLLGN